MIQLYLIAKLLVKLNLELALTFIPYPKELETDNSTGRLREYSWEETEWTGNCHGCTVTTVSSIAMAWCKSRILYEVVATVWHQWKQARPDKDMRTLPARSGAEGETNLSTKEGPRDESLESILTSSH